METTRGLLGLRDSTPSPLPLLSLTHKTHTHCSDAVESNRTLMPVAFDSTEMTLVKEVWGYEAPRACRGRGGGK